MNINHFADIGKMVGAVLSTIRRGERQMRWLDAEELKKTIAEKIKVDSYEKEDVINAVLQIISESSTVQPLVEKILNELQNEKNGLLSFIDGIDYAIALISAEIDTQKV